MCLNKNLASLWAHHIALEKPEDSINLQNEMKILNNVRLMTEETLKIAKERWEIKVRGERNRSLNSANQWLACREYAIVITSVKKKRTIDWEEQEICSTISNKSKGNSKQN